MTGWIDLIKTFVMDELSSVCKQQAEWVVLHILIFERTRVFVHHNAIAVKSWENNWEDLTTFFAYPAEIRRIIYTTNSVEGYHRQLRKVIKTKSSFPAPEAARKLLYLATMDITRKWTAPIRDWALVLNQLVIRFEDRIAI